MVKKCFKLVAACVIVALTTVAVKAQDQNTKFKKVKEVGGVQEYLYAPNGMNMLLIQDNAAPVVTVQVVYRVGSKHEVPGNTGSTHLLEHLNFKGTPTFNKDKGTGIFNLLQGVGAQMNATTWNDRTNYYETIPSDQLELALHIEADRMRNSLLLEEDKNAEMTVVRNEFEQGENNASSVLSKKMWATAYMAHPYHHSTIGWRSDIENMPIEVLRNFYDTYYWPNNATLTIVGDFNKDSLFKLIDKYFGKIGKSPKEMPQPYTKEPEQFGPRQVTIKKPGQQAVVSVAYKIPGRMHADLPALQVLSQLLGSGASSVINTTFVDSGEAVYGYADASNFKEVGLFTVTLGLTPDKDTELVKQKMLSMVEAVKTNGVQQTDVDRVVSKLSAKAILSRDGSGAISSELAEAIAGGDWTDYINATNRLSKVTAEDVKRIANSYLLEDQSTTGVFIPRIPGSQLDGTPGQASKFTESKYYFRNPELKNSSGQTVSLPESLVQFQDNNGYKLNLLETKSNTFERKTVAGIDVVTAQTAAKGFVTVAASFPIAAYFDGKSNSMMPSLTVQMLNRGTLLHDKLVFSQKLEKLGTSISFSSDKNNVKIHFKCLSNDVDEVVQMLAEALQKPLFDSKEFDLLKQQFVSGLKQGESDPGTQANIALSQALYPKGHPNYDNDLTDVVAEVEAVTVADLKTFHENYFGTAGMYWVTVGDVDTDALYKVLNQNFKTWKGGNTSQVKTEDPKPTVVQTKIITIPEKPSAEMLIGIYTGIERKDADYLPFYVGTSILGGGFSGRLMQTVRDEQGLTYGINAGHTGHNKTGGYWYINAAFNPELFQQGLEATKAQLKQWVEQGVTQKELDDKKASIVGSYKVGLATTSGLAGTLLTFLEQGRSPAYITQFPKDIEAVTLKQVNQSIAKYVDLNRLVVIKSGSLDQNSNPLK